MGWIVGDNARPRNEWANPEVDPYNSNLQRIDFPSALRTILSLPPSPLISRNYPSMRCYVGPQLDSFNYVKPRWIAGIIRKRLTQSWCPPRLTRSCSLTQRGTEGDQDQDRFHFHSFRFWRRSRKGAFFLFLERGGKRSFFFYRLKRECVKVWPGPLSSRTPKELNWISLN